MAWSTDRPVGAPTGVVGPDDPEGQAEADADHQGREHQLQGGRHMGQHVGEDLFAVVVRRPEVAVPETAEIADQLGPQRLVDAQLPA
jgi:hypothetical protein